MLLTVSEDSLFNSKLSELLLKNSMFSYFSSSASALEVLSDDSRITAIILDARASKKSSEAFCRTIKAQYPSIKIAAVIKKKLSDPALFLNVNGSDDQLIIPASISQFETFLLRFYTKNVPTFPCSKPHLYVSEEQKGALLLGYRLILTRSEKRILQLLSEFAEYYFTKDQIARLCLSERSAAAVTVHISNINKKAYIISERRLILKERNKGYAINKNM